MSKRTHSKVSMLRGCGPNATDIPSPTARGWDEKSTTPTCRKPKKCVRHTIWALSDNGPLVKISWKNHKDSEGKFKCPVCSRAHNKPNTAQQHYVTHFRPRFSCDDCKGKFHLSTQFRAHFLWKCKICQKEFTNGKTGLTNHIRKKHPDKVMEYNITHRGYKKLSTTTTEGMGKMEALVVPSPQKEIVQI